MMHIPEALLRRTGWTDAGNRPSGKDITSIWYAFHAPDAGAEQVFRDERVKELLELPLEPRLELQEFAL
jgi:hypothetical protein